MNWWAVFKREMVILRVKFGKPGYVVSSLFYPLIYLFAFGLGLAGRGCFTTCPSILRPNFAPERSIIRVRAARTSASGKRRSALRRKKPKLLKLD